MYSACLLAKGVGRIQEQLNMANQWFKFYGAEYLSDPKMDRLTVQERSCWLTLLCMASQTNGIIKYLSVEGLLNKSGIRFDPYDSSEWDNALNVLRSFEQYEMILIHKDGSVEVKNWEKRQEHNLTVAERVAKHRENKKSNENVTTDVTNVTTEESRVEENRIDKEDSSMKYLKEIPEADLEEFYARFDCSKSAIKSKAESLFLYCESKGKKYKNYRAFLLNALKKDFPPRKQQIQISTEEKIELPKGTLNSFKPNFLK